MDTEKVDSPQESPQLKVNWRSAAIASSLVSLSLLATLVVVVAVGGSNALATVALALAILAFAAQLLTFIAQTNASAQQLLHTERVNTETTGLLADMRATTQALLSTFGEHIGHLIDLVARQVSGPSDEEAEDEGERPLSRSSVDAEEVLRQLFEDRLREVEAATVQRVTRPRLSEEDQLVLVKLTSHPSEEQGRVAYAKLRELSPLAVAQLDKRARIEIGRLRAGKPRRPRRLAEDAPVSEELLQAGLVELVPPPADASEADRERRWAQLTPEGVEVARLVVGPSPLPDWLKELLRSGS